MKIVEIGTVAAWQQLQPAWNRLLESSASATTFLTWEWLNAWWSAYGTGDHLRILTAYDNAGVLRGIAPLRRETIARYGRQFDTLAFIGDGSSDSDYLDFIIEKGFEESVVTAFLAHCRADLDRGLILRLNDVPATAHTVEVLKTFVDNRHLWQEEAIPCATLQLPQSWDEYLGVLKPRFRTKVRSMLRNLEGRDEVRFGWCDDQAQLEGLLARLFELHTRRWNHEGKPGVFGWDRKRRFYHDLSRRLLEQGTLRFSWLKWNEQVLACQYGFVHGSTYLHLQEGYEPASEHWNVGAGLRAWTMRHFIRDGIREYDFLAGVGRHKTDWGAGIKESRRIVFAARSYRSLLFCRGADWEERARTGLKNLVPQALLDRRQARRERHLASAPVSTGEFVRQAAARFYYHSGLPAAAGLVHQRFQVSVPGNGRRSPSLTKRRKPTGRILYYHRVNDEGDPFFGATPVNVFERQMRYVARHYKVVSLTQLLAHLESGAPETLVAITFDDGYRDNYQNAFPILQRYRLPSTIFLATGSLDSGDPMWFEGLAGALKTTAREFLDVELDIPRRLWLRTTQERLRANAELFSLLRRMPDVERQQRFAAVMRELAPPDAAFRRQMMLTWDQVRRMKQHGVDFGGHTVTHPYLSRLTPNQAMFEVSECKHRIEAEVQSQVAHFAYPNGRDEDFAPWNKETLRAAGYQAAVTTLWGLNDNSTDRMELRRGQPWEDDEAVFAYKMDWYQLVNG